MKNFENKYKNIMVTRDNDQCGVVLHCPNYILWSLISILQIASMFFSPCVCMAGDSTERIGKYFGVQIVDSIEGYNFKMISVQRHPDSISAPRYGFITFVPYRQGFYELDYPILYHGDYNLDTLEVIAELLQFRGDTMLCSKRVKIWADFAPMYSTNISRYSIQVEALFLINLFYFNSNKYEERGDGYWYSSRAILVDTATQEEQSISGAIVDRAYDCYVQWFENVKEIGLVEARRRKLYPLTGCGIRWVGRNLR